ncbi:DUF4382 domain-containing protein [Puia sp. P3]|uniref:DUF4382 domain-containing protein n=1 Tax=Puia sp. P3 TaxID=3423952 RepID=UPI003D6658D9
MKTLKIIPRPFAWMPFFFIIAVACNKSAKGPGSGASGSNSVRIFLMDDPGLTFDHLFLDIQKLEIKVEDSDQREQEDHDRQGSEDRDRNGETSGGWVNVPISAGVYDILHFRNGLDTLFASTSFAASRSFEKIRLTLGSNNSIMVNGTSVPLTLNGNDNIVVIKVGDDLLDDRPSSFDISIDIDAGRSVVQHGSRVELKPVTRVFRKEKAGAIEGRVLPQDANPIVMAIHGADTATTRPEREGEFKITGLAPGTWSLLIRSMSGTYQDTVINNITVQKEDVHIGTVTLHR